MLRIEAPDQPAPTADLSRRIIRLQVITLVWMLIECGVALGAAWKAGSPALLAFGSDSLVELLSAAVVLFQFVSVFKLSAARAARMAGVLLFVLAAAVALTSAVALLRGAEPETSWAGIGITVAALVGMPVLSWRKRRIARAAENAALAADAVQSATCAYLAGITLLGLALNAAFHVGWMDPLAALAAIPILAIEGKRALRGKACGCCRESLADRQPTTPSRDATSSRG